MRTPLADGLDIVLASVIACLASLLATPASAQDAFIDVPLGRMVDGSTWTIRVQGAEGPTSTTNDIAPEVNVLLWQRRDPNRITGAPKAFNYAVKLTMNGQTRYSWRGEHHVEPGQWAGSQGVFGRLFFPGLARGSSYSYRVEIHTELGMRFVKEGTLEVDPEAPSHAALHLKRAADAMERAQASLDKARPGTSREFTATQSRAKALLQRARAQIAYGGADVGEMMEDVEAATELMMQLEQWPKPSDSTATDEAWTARLKRLRESHTKTLLDVAPASPEGIAFIQSLLPRVEELDDPSIESGVLRNLARYTYATTGSGSRATALLEQSYAKYKEAEVRRAAERNREPSVKELARQVLPTDFEPATLTRNEVQCQICDALDAIAKAERLMAFAEDEAARRKAVKQRDDAEAEVERLTDLLASIPAPTTNPRWETYQRTRNRTIRGSFDVTEPAQVAERDAALTRFDDLIFVEPDRSVHGNFQIALAHALPETAVRREPPVSLGEFIEAGGQRLEDISKAIEAAEKYRETSVAGERLRMIAEANKKCRAIIEAAGAFEAASPQRLVEVNALLAEAMLLIEEGGALSARNLEETSRLLKQLPADEFREISDIADHIGRMHGMHQKATWTGMIARQREWMSRVRDMSSQDWQRIKDTVNALEPLDRLEELRVIDKFMIATSMIQSIGDYVQRMERGEDQLEAFGRSLAPLCVDAVFTIIPVAGAADLVFEVAYISTRMLVHGDGDRRNISSTVKDLVQKGLDVWAATAWEAGELFAWVIDNPDGAAALRQIDPDDVRDYLARAECRLATLETDIYETRDFGATEEGAEALRLLRQRAVFRTLLRGQAEAGLDPWTEILDDEHRYLLSHPAGWSAENLSEAEPRIHRLRVTPEGLHPTRDHIYVEIQVVPPATMKALNRWATLQIPAFWWELRLGAPEMPELEFVEKPHRGERRGRPVNAAVYEADDQVGGERLWVSVQQVIHAEQSVEIRVVCKKDRLPEYRERLQEVASKIVFMRSRE